MLPAGRVKTVASDKDVVILRPSAAKAGAGAGGAPTAVRRVARRVAAVSLPVRKGDVPARSDSPGLLSPSIVRTGYIPRNALADAVLNRGLAALLLVFSAPVFVVVWLVVRLTSRDPVFYSGDRLGKDRKVFRILKFRTLHVDAQSRIGAQTLPKRSQLETPFGSYLRQSRIDELPQLINVLRGEMSLFGPRPIRPELEPVYAAEAPGFETRFLVRPGLIGFSQALLPHAASKRLRGRFNAMCCAAPVNYGYVAQFVALVALSVLRRALSGSVAGLRGLASPLGLHTYLRSGFAHPSSATITLDSERGPMVGALVSMSDEVLQFVTTLPVAPGPCEVMLSRRLSSGRTVRISVGAEVKAVLPLGIGKSGFAGYAVYTPESDYMRYRLERYFLDQTVIPC